MMNQQKGITLVALVITVIVLLILAGVALSMITGPESIFNHARNAANEYNAKSQEENHTMTNLLDVIDYQMNQ